MKTKPIEIHRFYAIGAKDCLIERNCFSYVTSLPIDFKHNPLSLVYDIQPRDCLTLSRDPDMALLFAWRSFFWRTVFETYKLYNGYYLIPVDEKTGQLILKDAVTLRDLYDASMVKLHGKDWNKYRYRLPRRSRRAKDNLVNTCQ